MSAITQTQKDALIKALDFVKGKVQASGLDPKWSSTTRTDAHNDAALTYDLEKTDIQSALTRIDTYLATWLT